MSTIASLARQIEENSLFTQLAALDQRPPKDLFANFDLRNPLIELAEQNKASYLCEQLAVQLNAFNEALDLAHEVGVCIIGVAGQGITFRPTDVAAWDPSLIIILGRSTVDGQPVQVIQHVSQLSVAFVTVPRADPAQPKRPIGFHSPSQAQEESAEATPR